jgi:hypothetical protein
LVVLANVDVLALAIGRWERLDMGEYDKFSSVGWLLPIG